MRRLSWFIIAGAVGFSPLASLELSHAALGAPGIQLENSAGQRCGTEGRTLKKSAKVTLKCTKERTRLIWRRVAGASTTKTEWNDLQIVFSRGGYAGQALTYSRSDANYKEFQSVTLVEGSPGYEIQALDYHRWSKTLLFSTYNISSRLHSIFRVSLGTKGARPSLVATGLFVIDGKIEIKSGDPILLVRGTGLFDYRLLQYSSIGTVEIWNAQSAGWSRSPLVFPRQIIPGTGGENWVSGSTSGGQGWRIDRISNLDGRFFADSYMVGSGELGGAAKGNVGLSDTYWALATSTAYFICKDPYLSSVFVPTAQNCRTMPALGGTSASAHRKMTFVIDPGRKGAISLLDINSGQLIDPESGAVRAFGLPGCSGCRVPVVNVQEINLDLFRILSTWRIINDSTVG